MGSVANLPPEEALKQVKVCENTLAEHKERVAELRGLVAQIASDVGLDANGPLHCEVEALGKRLEDVRETLSALADTADARALNQELARDDIYQTKNFLDSVQQSITSVGQGESNEQLKILRNHLLALTRTEPQLHSIKERTLDAASTQEPRIVDVLQLWQRVFRETFQQYHRLSARLVKTQDVAAALKLWQEYLTHVQEFLSNDVPGDYNGLSEHRNLCEVHKNLLTDQQNLILMVRVGEGRDISVSEHFTILTNLHNETLARIMERHAAVRDRLSAWDKYRIDQNKLLLWLKEIEREKGRLQLRFIHLSRIDKILKRIENMLERIPNGESQADCLQLQQEKLLMNCDETLAVSVRMEHAANLQRITNLRASLETWRDFITRIKRLNDRHVEQSSKITATFQEVSQALSAAFHAGHCTLTQTQQQLDSLQDLKTKLITSTTDLECLGVTTEQLRECLSPTDMKSLNQHCSLLWQQHGDLEHQLALLVYKLGERCGLHSRWSNRLARLLVWLDDADAKIDNCDSMLDEPDAALKRIECELEAEMALKQRELDWLDSTGRELIQVAEEGEKGRIKESLDELSERWSRLLTTGKTRANKLTDLVQTMSNLERRIAEIRSWLGAIECQLSEPFMIESVSQVAIDKKLEDHEQLQKMIETESGNVGEVLNLCEILLSDCDAWKVSFNTDAIKSGMEALEKRWKTTCIRLADRKRQILQIWKLLQDLEASRSNHEHWLTDIDSRVQELENAVKDISKEDTEKAIAKAKKISEDIKTRDSTLRLFEQSYSRLAKSGLEPENLKSLTGKIRHLIDWWHGLNQRVNVLTAALRQEQKVYREFITAHGAAVVGLTQVDVRLTELQHLTSPKQTTPRKKLQQLASIESDLETQNTILQKADELALVVMRESHPDDVNTLQALVDEYQLLWRDIKSRVAMLRSEIENQERLEVDEAVQVETLKFEQDSAVQVDTLPKLVRMTSCDAYLIELESALNECRMALTSLENAVTPEPTPGSGLTNAAKTIAKLIGSSQSTIDLAKHLNNLLLNDGKFDRECAKVSEIDDLVTRHENLLSQARAREQQIREMNDAGRLTCPICSRRNWAQLDNDLWRLEKWLEFAEGTQSEQYSPPSDIEQLEDVIQDHKEFLLDLDSHKSIVVSLNIVGLHLDDEHSEEIELQKRRKELKKRLARANVKWEKVCKAADKWQTSLKTTLMENSQFYLIIDEFLSWIEKTESAIRASEPIDLSEDSNLLRLKYQKFKELKNDLERCEPRVLSLKESADHLLDDDNEARGKLRELRLKLQSLRRLTGVYVVKIGATLGLDARDVGLISSTSSLASLSRDLLDEAATGTSQLNDTTSTDGDGEDETKLLRGCRFLGRVLRASLPIQGLMLLLLGAASLVPSAEEDYSCMLSNNLARSFTPLVEYPNGPPPL